MAQTNVSFEMNEKLLTELTDLCDELGMDTEDAFKLFAKKMVNQQEIPFEVTVDDLPNEDEPSTLVRVLKVTALVAAVTAAITLVVHFIRKCLN